MKQLGFIGAGNMAQALAQGLVARKVVRARAMIASDIDAARRRRFGRATGVPTTAQNHQVAADAQALILAVKPQVIDAVLEELHPVLAQLPGLPLIISIAAGIRLEHLQAKLPPKARVIRVMPNAPAMVGLGMTALVCGRGTGRGDEQFALKLFQAVGEAVALRDEGLLDAVTALSGSGPAYVYLYIKALADGAAAEGLPPQLALRMALQTVRGAEAMLRQSRKSPEELIRMVASPGGTTEAALKTHEAAGFANVVRQAIGAAAARSRELGQKR